MNNEQRRQRRKKAAELVEQGYTYSEVSEQMDMSAEWVRKACEEHLTQSTDEMRHFAQQKGIDRKVKGKGKKNYQNPFAILKTVLDGKSQYEAATLFNVSRARVNHIIKKAREGGFEV